MNDAKSGVSNVSSHRPAVLRSMILVIGAWAALGGGALAANPAPNADRDACPSVELRSALCSGAAIAPLAFGGISGPAETIGDPSARSGGGAIGRDSTATTVASDDTETKKVRSSKGTPHRPDATTFSRTLWAGGSIPVGQQRSADTAYGKLTCFGASSSSGTPRSCHWN